MALTPTPTPPRQPHVGSAIGAGGIRYQPHTHLADVADLKAVAHLWGEFSGYSQLSLLRYAG